MVTGTKVGQTASSNMLEDPNRKREVRLMKNRLNIVHNLRNIQNLACHHSLHYIGIPVLQQLWHGCFGYQLLIYTCGTAVMFFWSIQRSCKGMSEEKERICSLFRESCSCIGKSKSGINWRTSGSERVIPTKKPRQLIFFTSTITTCELIMMLTLTLVITLNLRAFCKFCHNCIWDFW